MPVIAAAATVPAVAASRNCDPHTVQWRKKSSFLGGTTDQSDIFWTSAANGEDFIPERNGNLTTVTNGVANGTYLSLYQSGKKKEGQIFTVNFPREIYCVEFYIADIDTQFGDNNNKFKDEVTVSGFTATPVGKGSQYLTVTGSMVTPKNTAASGRNANTWAFETNSTGGLVRFRSTGPVRQISMLWRNSIWSSGTQQNQNNQEIFLSPITYSATPCNCEF